MDDNIRLLFESEQLNGFYRFGAYGDMIARIGNADKDAKYVKSRLMTPARDVTNRNAIDLLLLDAGQSIADMFTYFGTHKLDTRSPQQWAMLMDCLACANRIMIVPNYRIFGIPGYRYIMNAAMFVDLFGRAADHAYAEHIDWSSMDDLQKRSRHIFIDIMCGRGGMWMEWAYDLGCEAATAMGLSFVDTYDNHAKLRYATLDGTFAKMYRKEALHQAIRFVAQQFDMLQASAFEDARGDVPYQVGSYGKPLTYMDIALSDLCKDLEAHVFVTGDCRAYCLCSCRNACNTIAILPIEYWYDDAFVLDYEVPKDSE